jgi:acyl-CoA synthetase (NDP forming)
MEKKMMDLEGLFNPESVAVIGASDNPGKLGYHVMKSLTLGGFPKDIIPINPGAEKIWDIPAYPSLEDYPGQVDLAIVVLPAKMVPGIFRECEKKGIKGVVLITAGFKEIEDPAGKDLHQEVAAIAGKAGIPIIGPNTFGMISFHADLNASFTPEFSRIRKGRIALVSQSGGMSHLLGFMAIREGVGFSAIIGLGNRINIDFAEMITYLMDDPNTRVIVLYVEGIDAPRALTETAKKFGGHKPMIVYKTGSSDAGDAASKSHTGSLAGKHEIYKGGFRQAGILPVEDAETLLDGAKALESCPLLESNGVAILTGQAGPGMAACDLCEGKGLKIAPFPDETQQRINECLPPLALRTNPVDMGPAWYDSEAIRNIVQAVMEAPNVHGILLLMMFASANVEAVKGLSPLLKEWKQQKPIIGCIVAPPGIWDEQIADLEESGALVNYPTPERAATAMAILREYRVLKERINKGFEDSRGRGFE